MAAPFVTGMAALYLQSYPELNQKEIRTYMQKSALDLGKKGKDDEYGYGLVQTPSNKVKLKSLEKELKKVEEQISELESSKASLENELTKPEVYNKPDKLKEVQSKFNQAISSLADANKKWEDLASGIDELSA